MTLKTIDLEVPYWRRAVNRTNISLSRKRSTASVRALTDSKNRFFSIRVRSRIKNQRVFRLLVLSPSVSFTVLLLNAELYVNGRCEIFIVS